ncbi:MAG: hypothetical protein IPJ79_17035 [Bacteroidetes bacterium]|nr:hypothetical protein [Bacteroidota bacterium]
MPDLNATQAQHLNTVSKKLKSSNWIKSQNIFESDVLLSGNENVTEKRNQLWQKINTITISSFESINVGTGNQSVYLLDANTPDDSAFISKGNNIVSDFLLSNVIALTSTNADSVRQSMLAKLGSQKIIPASKISYYLPKNIDGIFETGKFAITLVIGLIGTLALFMGLLNIAERAGGINVLSRFISPFLSKLFHLFRLVMLLSGTW